MTAILKEKDTFRVVSLSKYLNILLDMCLYGNNTQTK